MVKILGSLPLSNTIGRTMVSWLKVAIPEGALLCNGYSNSIAYFEEQHNLVKQMASNRRIAQTVIFAWRRNFMADSHFGGFLVICYALRHAATPFVPR
jgi:hypothetical protein